MRLLAVILLLSLTGNGQTVNDLRPTVTMKEYVDMLAQMNIEMDDIRAKNIEHSTATALESMDKRLNGMNEFRGTIEDSNATFITRKELFAWVIALLTTFFAYSNYKANQTRASNEGKAILSGDKVEVKK